ncbi:MAG: hypothetical protein HKN47_04235, partial [Pirellulaceae bacterium]|nr:hypothetical protein [Pirellulaceae bacterium]
GGADDIFLSAANYQLTIGNAIADNTSAAGDLDILTDISIHGASAATTTIDASGLGATPERVFHVFGGALSIDNLTVFGGSGGGSGGGGANVEIGSLDATDVIFDTNDGNNGGAIQNNDTLTMTRTIVSNNTSNSGAGINSSGTMTLTDVEMFGNIASNAGGAIRNSGTATLNSVTLRNNSANQGGGLYNGGGFANMSLTNVTISNNTAVTSGGGIFTNQTIAATNVTIAYNQTTAIGGTGGGIHAQGGAGDVDLLSSIVSNNTADVGTNSNKGLTSSGNNVVEDGVTLASTTTGDQINTDPLLDATLQNNGGFTSTHALQSGSLAINPTSDLGSPATDQRGVARVGTPDAGAFEFGGPVVNPVIDLDTDNSTGATGSDLNATFVVSSGPVAIADVDAALSDPDSTDLESMTVTITNLQDAGSEILAADTSGTSISASYDSGTGVLTLSGTDTVANYQQVLQSVTYDHLSATPDYTDRVITFVASDGTNDSNTATANVQIAQYGINVWLSTVGDTASPGASGLSSWSDSTALEFSGPSLTFEPGTTSGNLSAAFDIDTFAAANVNLTALHVVGTDMRIGSTIKHVDLQVGDVIFATDTATTFTSTNSLATQARDLVVFRADTTGDFSSGTFLMLLNNPIGGDITGVTLVESDTTVGGVDLNAGDILLLEDSDQILRYQVTDAGLNQTNGISSLLIDGSDIDLNEKFDGIELIEKTTIIGDTVLTAGQLLVSIDVDDADVGGTALADEDVAILDVTQAGETTIATSTLLMEGNDAGFDAASEDLNALAFQMNVAPEMDLDANDDSGVSGSDYYVNYTAGGAAINVADSDATLTDANTTGTLDSLLITLTNIQDTGLEFLVADTSGTLITSSYDGSTGALTLSGTDTVANYQQVLRTVTYQNFSGTPDLSTRTIEFIANDGIVNSNLAVTTLSIDAPILDLDANDSSGAIGADYQTTLQLGGPAVAIADVDATLTDSDSPNLESLTVTISNLSDGALESLDANVSGTSITKSYDSNTGILTLSGTDSVANYQLVLQSVTYDTDAVVPTGLQREITFVAEDSNGQGNVATTTVAFELTGTGLLMSTESDVGSPSGAPGLDSWTDSDVLAFSDPNLALEPGTTDGTFRGWFNAEDFTNGANTRGLHLVARDITIGTTDTVQLLAGDMLFIDSANDDFVSNNTLNVAPGDVVAFRPDVEGDFSSGTFIKVLDNPTGSDLRGVSLVESDTEVGGMTLRAGSFLLVENGSRDVLHFDVDDAGAGTTSGTSSVLIQGTDISFGQDIDGVELIEHTTVIGGKTLESGQILLSLTGDDSTVAGISTTRHDIFVLDVTQAGTNTIATASLLFEGADVNLDSGSEDVDAIALTVLGSRLFVDGSLSIDTTATVDGGLNLNNDGGNDAYLLADDGGAIFNGLGQLSLEVQFSSTTLPVDGGDADFISYAATSTSANDVWFGVYYDTGTSTSGLGIGIDNAFVYATSFDETTLYDGAQHTVSATWDGATGDYELFVDGVSVGSGSGLKAGHTISGGGELVIGMEQDSVGGSFQSSQVFQGTLFDARVFDDVRSAGEIAAGHGQTLDRTESGLLANWTFNDLSLGGVVTDTVNANHLTVMHASGGGFSASTPNLTMTLTENPANGTEVGWVTGTDTQREAKIASLLAADPDLTYSEVTGKFYKVVSGTTSWSAAQSAATTTPLSGVNGELATIRSAAENEVVHGIAQTLGSNVWLGASDEVTEGEWRWYDSTTPADQFWQGDGSGNATNGAFANWNGTNPNAGTGDDDYAILRQADGRWADRGAGTNQSYVVQWNADDVLDQTDVITYSLAPGGDAGGRFAVDAVSGQITVADGSLIDFESATSHTITVRITDNAANTVDRDFTITIRDANDAPVLDNSGVMTLATINEGETNTFGDLVSAIIASAGGDRITDPDAGAVEGLAITSVDSSGGVWQYSTNNGASWTTIAAATDSTAVALTSTANDRIRFVPDTNFNGVATFTARAWDTTDGATSGSIVDTTANGGATAFSTDVETVQITVDPVQIVLYLSTAGDVTASGAPGLDDWNAGDMLGFGDPNIDFEPGTTSGTFYNELDLGSFASDGSTNISAMHVVQNDITLGGDTQPTIDILAGDLMLAVTNNNETFTGSDLVSISPNKADVFVFRPDTPGDYSAGSFFILLDGVASNAVSGISLVETATLVGDQ